MDEPGSRSRQRTETFELTVSGLLTKRADTLGELIRLRERQIEVEADLVAMDRVLAAFGYQGDLEAVPPRVVRDAPFGRGQVMRTILDHMRAAGRPVTARQIAEEAFAQLREDRDDPVPLESLSRRVVKSLGRLRKDGAVTSATTSAGVMVWSLRVQ